MSLESRLRRVPRWAWIILGVFALVLACICGGVIGASGQAAAEQEPPSVTQTQQHTTPPATTHAVTPDPTRTVVTPKPVETSTDPCVERDRCVSPENLDAAWPLTVPWAEIDCMWWYAPGAEKQKMVWVVAPSGEAYAVNGTAKAHLQ